MKELKPATEAQKTARERNWNKGQVRCLKTISHNINRSKTTNKEERKSLDLIINHLNKILKNWNTEI